MMHDRSRKIVGLRRRCEKHVGLCDRTDASANNANLDFSVESFSSVDRRTSTEPCTSAFENDEQLFDLGLT
jgi:hypothetical protein